MVGRTLRAEHGEVRYWAPANPDPTRRWMAFPPGLSADHTLFDSKFAHFARRWNLVAWGAPGHGLSRPWRGRLDLDDVAGALHSILGECGATSPILVGQSLGGYVAQVYIDLFPGRVAAFVSVGSSPPCSGATTRGGTLPCCATWRGCAGSGAPRASCAPRLRGTARPPNTAGRA